MFVFERIIRYVKGTTFWTEYSAIKSLLSIKYNVDCSKWNRVVAFLKRKQDTEKKKKPKTFTKENIENYIKSYQSATHERDKLALLLGLFGALRAEELAALCFSDLKEIDNNTLCSDRASSLAGDQGLWVRTRAEVNELLRLSNRGVRGLFIEVSFVGEQTSSRLITPLSVWGCKQCAL